MSGRREGYGEMRGRPEDGKHPDEWTFYAGNVQAQCCKMAKFDPFLSLDCAGMEGVGMAQSKERKGSNFAA